MNGLPVPCRDGTESKLSCANENKTHLEIRFWRTTVELQLNATWVVLVPRRLAAVAATAKLDRNSK